MKMKGEDFLNTFGSHNDPFTTIDPNQTYAVKAPTAHPVYEDFRVKVHYQTLSQKSCLPSVVHILCLSVVSVYFVWQ